MYNTGDRETALTKLETQKQLNFKKSMYLLLIFKIIWQKVQ